MPLTKSSESDQSLLEFKLPSFIGSNFSLFAIAVAIFATDLVIFLVTNSSPRFRPSWLNKILCIANRLYDSRYTLTMCLAAALDAPYGLLGFIGCLMSCGE